MCKGELKGEGRVERRRKEGLTALKRANGEENAHMNRCVLCQWEGDTAVIWILQEGVSIR
jgi:hypothetical protein